MRKVVALAVIVIVGLLAAAPAQAWVKAYHVHPGSTH